ncbi:hypothetical protein DPM19_29675 [Actinomadura craniellae]|uniref:AAA+ ATPase domain-containing protein n=2 Tax=Actinomadura craniellae TaxID=2231787 RepID=A0A365GXB8_9ACTN|nr:hypothetical protein DPM19_29675 [Actinomadura craniellae]
MVSAGWWQAAPPQQRQHAIAGRVLVLPDGTWWLYGAWARWYRWHGSDGQWYLCPPPRATATRQAARPAQQAGQLPALPPHVVPAGPDFSFKPPMALPFVGHGFAPDLTARIKATVESAAALPATDYPHWWTLFSSTTPSTVAVAWGVMLWCGAAPVFDSRLDEQMLGIWSPYRAKPLPPIDGPRWLTPPPLEALVGLYAERLRANRVDAAVVLLRTMWAVAGILRDDPRFQARADGLLAILGGTLNNPTVDYGALAYGDQALVQQWLTRCPPHLAPALRDESSPGDNLRHAFYDLARAIGKAAGDPADPAYIEPRLVAASLLAADLATVRQEVAGQIIPWLDPEVRYTVQAVLTQHGHPLRRLWPEDARLPDLLRGRLGDAGEKLLAAAYTADLAWCRLAGGMPARPRGFPVPTAILAELVGAERAKAAAAASTVTPPPQAVQGQPGTPPAPGPGGWPGAPGAAPQPPFGAPGAGGPPAPFASAQGAPPADPPGTDRPFVQGPAGDAAEQEQGEENHAVPYTALGFRAPQAAGPALGGGAAAQQPGWPGAPGAGQAWPGAQPPAPGAGSGQPWPGTPGAEAGQPWPGAPGGAPAQGGPAWPGAQSPMPGAGAPGEASPAWPGAQGAPGEAWQAAQSPMPGAQSPAGAETPGAQGAPGAEAGQAWPGTPGAEAGQAWQAAQSPMPGAGAGQPWAGAAGGEAPPGPAAGWPGGQAGAQTPAPGGEAAPGGGQQFVQPADAEDEQPEENHAVPYTALGFQAPPVGGPARPGPNQPGDAQWNAQPGIPGPAPHGGAEHWSPPHGADQAAPPGARGAAPQGAESWQPPYGGGQGVPGEEGPQGAEHWSPPYGSGQGAPAESSQGAEHGSPAYGAGQGAPAQGAEHGSPAYGAGQGAGRPGQNDLEGTRVDGGVRGPVPPGPPVPPRTAVLREDDGQEGAGAAPPPGTRIMSETMVGDFGFLDETPAPARPVHEIEPPPAQVSRQVTERFGIGFVSGDEDVADLLDGLAGAAAVEPPASPDATRVDGSAGAPNVLLVGSPHTGQRRLARMIALTLADTGLGDGSIRIVTADDVRDDPRLSAALERPAPVTLFEGLDAAVLGAADPAAVAEHTRRSRARAVLTAMIATCEPRAFKRLSEEHPRLVESFRVYRLPDLTRLDRRMTLLHVLADERRVTIGSGALEAAEADLDRLRGPGGLVNARLVETYLEQAVQRHVSRSGVSRDRPALAAEDFAGVAESIEPALRPPGDIDGYLRQLDGLLGLEEVKRTVGDLVEDARSAAERVRHGVSSGSGRHLIFLGPPGTGKATVAGLLGGIYAALGLLTSGHVVACRPVHLAGRDALDTENRVTGMVDQAMGGVLLIQEAYRLDRSPEVVAELLRLMGERREGFMVVCTSPAAEMDGFLGASPAFCAEFGSVVEFPGLGDRQLVQLFQRYAERDLYLLEEELRVELLARFGRMRDSPGFAHARTVRQIFEGTVARQAARLSGADVSAATVARLSVRDLPESTMEQILGGLHRNG